MQAAYPDLSAEDTCEGFHRHEDRVYNLARAIAAAVHECEPSDEQVAWFLNDADAVVDDFTPTPETWEVVNHGYPEDEPGLDFVMRVNGVEYVVQESEWEPATPVKRETWESWTRGDEGVSIHAHCSHGDILSGEHDVGVDSDENSVLQ